MSQHSLFGAIAVKLNLLKLEEVESAAMEQKRLSDAGIQKRLGEILHDRKLLNNDQIQKIVNYQKTINLALEDTLFGELAINNQFITSEQLEKSLKRQREDAFAQRIGEILNERGFITVAQKEAILTCQARLR